MRTMRNGMSRFSYSKRNKMSEKELLKGNIAIAKTALMAGCSCYFGYPITPQTEIGEFLSG